RDGDTWRASGRLDLADVTVDHRAVSSQRIEHLQPHLEGELQFSDGVLATGGLALTLAPLTVRLSGTWGRGEFDVRAQVEPLACNQALGALRPILPAIDGLLVDGRLGG